MKKLTLQLLCVSVLAFLALADGAPPALASDVNNSSATLTSAFGTSIATTPPLSLSVPGDYTATVSEQVFLSAGVYTYVFTVADSLGSAGLSQGSTATTHSPLPLDEFSSSLSYGVMTNTSFTSSGVGASGFTFNPNSTTVLFANGCSSAVPPVCTGGALLPAGDEITFYLQSTIGPEGGTISTEDGGQSADGASLDPGPEPSSILLFGTGLLVFGVLLRRRLPQPAAL